MVHTPDSFRVPPCAGQVRGFSQACSWGWRSTRNRSTSPGDLEAVAKVVRALRAPHRRLRFVYEAVRPVGITKVGNLVATAKSGQRVAEYSC